MKKERTYTDSSELTYPHLFDLLAQDQKRDAIALLQKLDKDTGQSVLNEWAVRCEQNQIRNRAAYLFGILKKAKSNTFRPTVQTQPKPLTPSLPDKPKTDDYQPATPKEALVYLAAIRAKMKRR